MRFNKIIAVFISVLLFVPVLCLPASASSSYVEYSEYSGVAISASVANILEGFALNYIRSPDSDYKYWTAARVGQYEYIIWIFEELDHFKTGSTCELTEGIVIIYNERLYSYTEDIRTYYQAGFTYSSVPCTLQMTRVFTYGNVEGTIAIDADNETAIHDPNIKYILYTLIVFLLLFVAFKFLNKRWLLP